MCFFPSFTGQVAVGEETKLLFSFENPLPVDMKDVTLNIDVDGMKDGTPHSVFRMGCAYMQ